ncbi:hypothetical protein [Actinopolymorpha alba]|uniref:hypothetical protein n=1 Tax=Actinopolymorpha alba TaxID=533267 RepID=UPI00037F2381|nr:hypothetical protein [Actinopolymorpha alba]
MTTRVLGIDPSLTATGLALPDGATCTIRGNADEGDQRLHKIAVRLRDAAIGVDLAVIEDLPTHAQGAGKTGMAQGVIRLALIEAEVPYVTVTPATLKKYACGRGTGVDKADMRMALYKRAGLDIRDDNQVDAWWLRALGHDLAGHPLVQLPQTHRDALAKVIWPGRDLMAVPA